MQRWCYPDFLVPAPVGWVECSVAEALRLVPDVSRLDGGNGDYPFHTFLRQLPLDSCP